MDAYYDRDRFLDDLGAAYETIEDLRAVLAPKLDNPLEHDGDNTCDFCIWCDASNYWIQYDKPRPELKHEPTCPVLRKDRLLGRQP
jgi:hypothetical protein